MKNTNVMACDVLIVGTGVAGLYCALNLPSSLNIVIISKARAEECDSYLAQGGICVLKDESDYDAYFEDTMRAGHYENNKASVDTMIRQSPEVIRDLIRYGARFERDAAGGLKYTKEGAHSQPRILFHEDITGKEITSHLLQAVRALPNVRIYEQVTMLDILEGSAADGSPCCKGAVVHCLAGSPLLAELAGVAVSDGALPAAGAEPVTGASAAVPAEDGGYILPIYAAETVWACGGIGGLYPHSTNWPHLTGDALGIALKHKIPLQNPDYVQIHPTTLYIAEDAQAEAAGKKRERAFLISESVRGEGGILYSRLPKDGGVRFINELLPRDVVTEAILAQMKKDGSDCVWLSMEKIPREEIVTHFKHIYERCLEAGYDCTREPIPVVPAQHYFMGGVDVNAQSRTSLQALYAVGETSCNGVHGKNRLASNSLLESLVFARIAARQIAAEIGGYQQAAELAAGDKAAPPAVNYEEYRSPEKVFAGYRRIILDEIKRMKDYHEQHHHENERGQLNSASA